VWSPSSVQYFKRLEHIHSKFRLLIPATQRFLHHTLAEHRRFHTAIIVYKIFCQLSPAYLRETFNYTTTVSFHVGRNIHRLFVARVRTTHSKNSFCYKSTQIWNSLNASLMLQLLLDNLNVYISLTSNCIYMYVNVIAS